MNSNTRQKDEYRLAIYAHRGLARWSFPENSLEAFREAQKFDFPSECDVWQSADGEPVVIHDPTLDRTTTGSGAVADLNVSQLRAVRCRIAGVDLSFAPVPLLSDVSGLVSLVELKPDNAQELVRRVVRIMSGRAWQFQSFDDANVHHALREDPQVPVAFLIEDLDGLDVAISNGWTVHADHMLLDDRSVARIQDAGLHLGAWTVNTEDEIMRVLQWRPDAIISDQPHIVRKIAQRSGIACT